MRLLTILLPAISLIPTVVSLPSPTYTDSCGTCRNLTIKVYATATNNEIEPLTDISTYALVNAYYKVLPPFSKPDTPKTAAANSTSLPCTARPLHATKSTTPPPCRYCCTAAHTQKCIGIWELGGQVQSRTAGGVQQIKQGTRL